MSKIRNVILLSFYSESEEELLELLVLLSLESLEEEEESKKNFVMCSFMILSIDRLNFFAFLCLSFFEFFDDLRCFFLCLLIVLKKSNC